jgi:hypothetical protein
VLVQFLRKMITTTLWGDSSRWESKSIRQCSEVTVASGEVSEENVNIVNGCMNRLILCLGLSVFLSATPLALCVTEQSCPCPLMRLFISDMCVASSHTRQSRKNAKFKPEHVCIHRWDVVTWNCHVISHHSTLTDAKRLSAWCRSYRKPTTP